MRGGAASVEKAKALSKQKRAGADARNSRDCSPASLI